LFCQPRIDASSCFRRLATGDGSWLRVVCAVTQWRGKNMTKSAYRILCLGGGATNLTLMSGALLTLHRAWLDDEKKRPNVITMAGAGAVVGLHYLAPKGMTSADPSIEALENTVNIGVSDQIYEMCPINYKVFGKSGPSADLFNAYWSSLPEVQAAMRQSKMTEAEVLSSDWLLFQGALMCPTDVNFFSLGFCEHPRLFDELIDFEKLQKLDPNDVEIEINAFCIEDRKLVDFTNYEIDEKTGRPITRTNGELIPKEITIDHLKAALSFPFIHPPYKIGNRHYYEGAAYQCLNDYLPKDAEKIEWIVVLDPLRTKMVGMPRNLWDAFALCILLPTIGLAEMGRSILEIRQDYSAKVGLQDWPKDVPLNTTHLMLAQSDRLHLLDYSIDDDKVSESWGWSRSNMKYLFEKGKTAGDTIVKNLGY
jgi:NTE family protein